MSSEQVGADDPAPLAAASFIDPHSGGLSVPADYHGVLELRVRNVQLGRSELWSDGYALGPLEPSSAANSGIEYTAGLLRLHFAGAMRIGRHQLRLRTAGAEIEEFSPPIILEVTPAATPNPAEDVVVELAPGNVLDPDASEIALRHDAWGSALVWLTENADGRTTQLAWAPASTDGLGIEFGATQRFELEGRPPLRCSDAEPRCDASTLAGVAIARAPDDPLRLRLAWLGPGAREIRAQNIAVPSPSPSPSPSRGRAAVAEPSFVLAHAERVHQSGRSGPAMREASRFEALAFVGDSLWVQWYAPLDAERARPGDRGLSTIDWEAAEHGGDLAAAIPLPHTDDLELGPPVLRAIGPGTAGRHSGRALVFGQSSAWFVEAARVSGAALPVDTGLRQRPRLHSSARRRWTAIAAPWAGEHVIAIDDAGHVQTLPPLAEDASANAGSARPTAAVVAGRALFLVPNASGAMTLYASDGGEFSSRAVDHACDDVYVLQSGPQHYERAVVGWLCSSGGQLRVGSLRLAPPA